MQGDFGIRVGGEVILGGQPVSELAKVIDFAVADNAGCAFFGQDGLMSAGHIHYGEPGMSKDMVTMKMEAAIIRPPVGHGVQHAVDSLFISPSQAAGNTTHVASP
jgi:hypothetical protein